VGRGDASVPTRHLHNPRPYASGKQEKSLFILPWDEKAVIFRGSTQIPRLALKGKSTLW
jgi:hypothetical protein